MFMLSASVQRRLRLPASGQCYLVPLLLYLGCSRFPTVSWLSVAAVLLLLLLLCVAAALTGSW